MHCPGCAARENEFPGGHRDGCTESRIGKPCNLARLYEEGETGMLSPCTNAIPCLEHDTLRALTKLWEANGFGNHLVGIGAKLVDECARAADRIKELEEWGNASYKRADGFKAELAAANGVANAEREKFNTRTAELDSVIAERNDHIAAGDKLRARAIVAEGECEIARKQLAAVFDGTEVATLQRQNGELADRLTKVTRERDEYLEELTHGIDPARVMSSLEHLAHPICGAPLRKFGEWEVVLCSRPEGACVEHPHGEMTPMPPQPEKAPEPEPQPAAVATGELTSAFLDAVVEATADRVLDLLFPEGE